MKFRTIAVTKSNNILFPSQYTTANYCKHYQEPESNQVLLIKKNIIQKKEISSNNHWLEPVARYVIISRQ